MNDFIKAPVILAGYLLFGPLLGFLLKGNRRGQRWAFSLMVFMTSWHINKFTLMLCSVEAYRGHTKGFEFTFIEILSVALIVAAALERKPGDRSWRWLPPGVLLYLLYCAVSWLSLAEAPDKLYAAMAGVRFTKAVLIMVASFHFMRQEEDLYVLLKALAITLLVQMGVVLKMKYVDHSYQVHGWFEHQNPLSMWAYMCGLPLLGAAMSKVPAQQTRWCTLGFAASAVIVQGSLSRAGLAMFALGSVAVVGLSLFDGITRKRIVYIVCMGALGTLGILLAAATILSRFHDEGNDASAETRVLMNLASKEMLHASPFGVGWNNFALTVNHPFPYGDVIDDGEREKGHPVDEDYAQGVVESHYWLLLAETGWGGYLTYMLFIAVTGSWCLLAAWRWRRQFLAAFMGALAVALALTYLHSTLERVLTQTKNYSMWLIYLGVAARVETWRRVSRDKGRG